MAGLVPAIHVFSFRRALLKTWMPGTTSAGMTNWLPAAFSSKVEAGSRQIKNLEPVFDSIETGSSSVAATTPLRYGWIRTDAGNAP
jgi:hypothetical protein